MRFPAKTFLLGSVAVASVTTSTTVTSEPCKCTGKSHGKLSRPSELPIYDTTPHHHDTQILSKSNFLEEPVRNVRYAMTDVWGSVSDSTTKISDVISTGKAHTIGTIYFLREESNVLPRIGAIVAGGLTGLLFAIRGKFFKKLVYSSIGAGALASLCYPNEARQVSASSFTIAKYYAIISYNRIQDELGNKKAVKVATKESVTPIEVVGQQETEKVAPSSTKLKIDKLEKDYGQSNPEDKDMYTTRGKA